MTRRRAARAQRAAPAVDEQPPDWIWRYREADWPLTQAEVMAEHHRGDAPPSWSPWFTALSMGRAAWKKAARQWLEERGLVLYGVSGIGRAEYDRIAREEPWRILRRPVRPTPRVRPSTPPTTTTPPAASP